MPHECRLFRYTEAGGVAWRECQECGRKERGRWVPTNVAGGDAAYPQRRRWED